MPSSMHLLIRATRVIPRTHARPIYVVVVDLPMTHKINVIQRCKDLFSLSVNQEDVLQDEVSSIILSLPGGGRPAHFSRCSDNHAHLSYHRKIVDNNNQIVHNYGHYLAQMYKPAVLLRTKTFWATATMMRSPLTF